MAIPVFFALIGVELLVLRLQGRRCYRLADSMADMGCGVIDQLTDVFLKTALFAGYAFVYEHLRLWSLPGDALWAWVACFLGVDFCYYWFHRTSHEVNAVWAAHVVHHQSEEYNLTVALRQSALQASFAWVFYLPLAWLGFPPLMFLTLSAFNTLYQFWIHTRTIGKLGALEGFLNTPSNHRVHHGRNPKYIDRNHGGTLIIWDRLFGTYVPEDEEPVYGITAPVQSWNPLWANFHEWVRLLRLARAMPRWSDRLRLFLKPPGWRPQELGGRLRAPEVDRASYRKYDTPVPAGLAAYAFLQWLLVLGIATLLLFRQAELDRATLALGAAGVVLSLVSLGALFDRRRWAWRLEALRVVALALGLAGVSVGHGGALLAATLWGLLGVALVLWLTRYRELFVHTPLAPTPR